jgi:anti-anti-sigma factor
MITGIDVEHTPSEVAVVVVTGEHDLSTATPLEDAITDAISSAPAVVIDLDHAEFIDSAVLRVLILGQQRAEEAGKGFAIAITDSTGHAVRRLLELTGLDRKLTLASGRDAAVAEALSTRDGQPG